jgi:hypothetical protein
MLLLLFLVLGHGDAWIRLDVVCGLVRCFVGCPKNMSWTL